MPRPNGSTRAWRKVREHVWQRDGARCRACGTTTHLSRCTRRGCPRCYQAGHRVPLARGGSDHPANLLCLCAECNAAMGDRTFDEWAKQGGPALRFLARPAPADTRIWRTNPYGSGTMKGGEMPHGRYGSASESERSPAE